MKPCTVSPRNASLLPFSLFRSRYISAISQPISGERSDTLFRPRYTFRSFFPEESGCMLNRPHPARHTVSSSVMPSRASSEPICSSLHPRNLSPSALFSGVISVTRLSPMNTASSRSFPASGDISARPVFSALIRRSSVIPERKLRSVTLLWLKCSSSSCVSPSRQARSVM